MEYNYHSGNLGSNPYLKSAMALIFASMLASACSSNDDDKSALVTDPDSVSDQPADDATSVTSSSDTDTDDTDATTTGGGSDELAIPGLTVTGLNGADPESLVSPWLVLVDLFSVASPTETSGSAFVDLSRYSDDFRVSNHIDFYTPDMDACELDNATDDDGDDDDDGGSPPATISGGESVIINSAGGPLFTLGRSVDDDRNVSYSDTNGYPGGLPVNATLSIPGDRFPNVAAYPLHEPTAPVRLTPDDVPLTRSATYTWIAGESSDGMVLDFLGYDENGDFTGFKAFCLAQDDGSFDVTDEVLNLIDSSDDDIYVRYARRFRRVDFIDNIVFFQNTLVAE